MSVLAFRVRQCGKDAASGRVFSHIFGRGVYVCDGSVIADPLRAIDRDLLESEHEANSLVLTNEFTGEHFFARRLGRSFSEKERLKNMVLNPPPSDVVLWPQDFVTLEPEQRGTCTSAVWRVYDSAPPEDGAIDVCGEALLFPMEGFPFVMSCAELIDMQEDALRTRSVRSRHNWTHEGVRQMAIALLRALVRLNESGYAYLDIHRSRIFFRVENEGIEGAFFDFSGLCCAMGDFSDHSKLHLHPVFPYYPLEFADPAYLDGSSYLDGYSKNIDGRHISQPLDFESQNLSLAAFLFYLLMGRHPYDGQRLYGKLDDNLQHHYVRLREYSKATVFVFDQHDTSNGFDSGLFEKEKEIMALWEGLPEPVRNGFDDVLREDHALRRDRYHRNLTPQQWLHMLEKLNWS